MISISENTRKIQDKHEATEERVCDCKECKDIAISCFAIDNIDILIESETLNEIESHLNKRKTQSGNHWHNLTL